MNLANPTAVYRLNNYIPDPNLLRLLPEKVARECLAVPLHMRNGGLVVATAAPNDHRSLRRLAMAAKRPIYPRTTPYPDIRDALELAYGPAAPVRNAAADAEVCRRMGYLVPEEIARVQAKAEKRQQPFLDACESLGLMDDESLAEARSLLSHLAHVRGKSINNISDLSELIPWRIAEDCRVIPLAWIGKHLLVGSPKPATQAQIREMAEEIGLPIQYTLLSRGTWERLFRRFYLRGELLPDLDRAVAQSLVQQELLTRTDYEGALSLQEQTGRQLQEALISLKLVDPRDWFQAKARAYKVPFQDLTKNPPRETPDLQRIRAQIPPMVAAALGILPLMVGEDHCVVGLTEPTHKRIRTIEQILDRQVEVRLVDPQQVQAFYPSNPQQWEEPGLPDPHEYAVHLGYISPLLMEEARSQKSRSKSSEDILVSANLIDEIDLTELVGLSTDLPFTQLERVQFSETELREVPAELIIRHTCIPIISTANQLWLAVSDPLDGAALREVEVATGKRVWPLLAPADIIQSVIDRYIAPRAKTDNRQAVTIVEKLVDQALLTQFEASRALQLYAGGTKPLDVALTAECIYKPDELIRALARIIGVPAVSLLLRERETEMIDPMGARITRTAVSDPVEAGAARLITLEKAEKWCALPIHASNGELVVVFADPLYQPALNDLQATTQRKIQPVLAPRRQVEEAIQRTLGHRNLGTYLLLAGLVSHQQLDQALSLARRTGVRLGQALVNRRFITPGQLYQFIAQQSGLPFYDLSQIELDEAIARSLSPQIERQYGILPFKEEDGAILIAITDPLNSMARSIARAAFTQPIKPVVVTDLDLDAAFERVYHQDYLEQSTSELLERTPEDSAFHILSTGQKIFFIAFLLISAAWIFFNHLSYFIVLNIFATLFYVAFSVYKLYLIYGALNENLEVPVTQEEIDALDESTLPVYTILIPVYKEAEVLPDLLTAIDNFDYPRTKLDIKVLMEEDDKETIQAFHNWNPPAHFHGVIVPFGQPKTKPKACNYGLIQARGEFIVIFDAEDLPERDQLRRAVAAFRKVDQNVVCIQSKLNYFNANQNLLTRWFTIEYSMWFDLFLPGLVASGAPVPLGGTSNHFRREALIECGAWDPYNVTEDADLGIRLYKRGYKTAIIDSTTYEEANSKVGNWVRQRSRWIKGYIVTWLVHMRHPVRLIREIGWKAFFGFQFVVAGTFFSALVNPIYWVFTTLWFLLNWQFIKNIFPPEIFYLGALCLYVGNFAFTYINVAGVLRRRFYGMVKYALVSPFYWAMASIGAWRGFIQLFTNPSYWEKTVHGLGPGNNKPGNGAAPGGS